MRWTGYINPDSVRQAIDVLQVPGGVFEVRVIGTGRNKPIMSGYFKDADTLLKEFDSIDLRGRNVYITLGRVKDDCFARPQSGHFEPNQQATSDGEIISYRW